MANETFTFNDNLSKILKSGPEEVTSYIKIIGCNVVNGSDEDNECNLILNTGEGDDPVTLLNHTLSANQSKDFMESYDSIYLEPGFSLSFNCTKAETSLTLDWE